ncbi:hypothetical protein IKS86_07795 [bacterium]|nr:hypothetical protein [bacterium]
MKKFLKTAAFFIVFLTFSALSATEEDSIFATQLYNQAYALLSSAKPQCKELTQKNKTLANAVSELYKKAQDKRNTATNVFANADYLLKFLQERIDETCGLVEIANEESIRIIIAQEFDQLLSQHKQSANFEEFIDKIFGTEYAKFLYLVTSVSSLEKMYTKWAAKMVANRKDVKKMISNIAAANTELKQELTDFTKTFKLYYKK